MALRIDNSNNFEFKGSFNERDILIHAINSYKKQSPAYIGQAFPNIHDKDKMEYIEAVVYESRLLEEVHSSTSLQKIFKMKSSTLKLVFENSVEEVVDLFLKSSGKNIKPDNPMDKYKLAAFKAIEEHGIGYEFVWNSIAEKAGIPENMWEDVKNILYHEGYMYKTSAAQGIGDLAKGLPSITAAKYGLENKMPFVQIHQNFNAGRDIVQSGNISNLNLGQIVGNVYSNVEMLNTDESKGIGEAIKKLTDTIATSSELDGEIKIEFAQYLKMFSEEAIKEKAERNNSVLKAVIKSFASGLANFANLAQVWDVFGIQITKFFGIS